MGKYALSQPGRISFTVGSTRMMCEGERMETENSLMKVFGMADSYLVKGDTLHLFKAKMAPLAKFKAEYFK
ncbi:MAG: META domain-containing protein [Chitinophagaceae bacterium]|nr:META domain-containing protein [Chitinophagaceae bacterium]